MPARIRELDESDFDSALLAWARAFVPDLADDKYPDLYELADFSEDQHLALAWVIDEFLTAPEPSLRLWGAWVLGELNFLPEDAVESVRALLHDADEEVRLAAAWAAGKLGSHGNELIDELDAAASSENQAIQVAALESLSMLEITQSDVAATLLRRSHSQSDCVRFAAVEALGSVANREPAARQRLAEALTDAYASVREYAAHGIGWSATHDPGIIASLRAALADSDEGVLLTSAWALGQIAGGQEEHVPALLRAMAHVRWLPVPGFADEDSARIEISDDLTRTLNALLRKLKDPSFDDFRRQFLAGAFHPDAPLPSWAVRMAHDGWIRKMLLARYEHREARRGPQLRDELMEKSIDKLLTRLAKNPTLGVVPERFGELPGYVKNHATSIAASIRRSYLRTRRYKELALSFEPATATASVADELEQRDQVDTLFSLIASELDFAQAEVIRYRYDKNLSIAQTAAALGMSVSRVRTLEQNALAMLRRRLRR